MKFAESIRFCGTQCTDVGDGVSNQVNVRVSLKPALGDVKLSLRFLEVLPFSLFLYRNTPVSVLCCAGNASCTHRL